ncbi:unnamed protein product [Cylindrotheca closterium]|uniref:Helicase-associated domain-containing protein n=1 Tax=Cylindrotheca closterium TaxID=2856 RepID=A0AAD2CME1_9STRA|nr:unnamed protein product [Cylindrotheca closterium]
MDSQIARSISEDNNSSDDEWTPPPMRSNHDHHGNDTRSKVSRINIRVGSKQAPTTSNRLKPSKEAVIKKVSPNKRKAAFARNFEWLKYIMKTHHPNGGYVLPARDCPENKTFRRWIQTIRYQYRQKRYGELSYITDEQIQQLNGIGFLWEKPMPSNKHEQPQGSINKDSSKPNETRNSSVATKSMPTPQRTNRTSNIKATTTQLDSSKNPKERWDVRFDKLVAHKKIHEWDKPKLSRWVARQRFLYKNKILSDDRIQKLNSIGFLWEGKEEEGSAASLRMKKVSEERSKVSNKASRSQKGNNVHQSTSGSIKSSRRSRDASIPSQHDDSGPIIVIDDDDEELEWIDETAPCSNLNESVNNQNESIDDHSRKTKELTTKSTLKRKRKSAVGDCDGEEKEKSKPNRRNDSSTTFLSPPSKKTKADSDVLSDPSSSSPFERLGKDDLLHLCMDQLVKKLCADKDAQLNALKNELRDLQSEKEKAKQTMQSISQDFSDNMKGLKQELERRRLEQIHTEESLRAENCKLKRAISQVLETCESRKSIIADREKVATELHHMNQSLQKSKLDNEQHLNRANKDVHSFKAKLQNALLHQRAYLGENLSLRQANDKMKQTIVGLENQLEDLEEEKNQMKMKHAMELGFQEGAEDDIP